MGGAGTRALRHAGDRELALLVAYVLLLNTGGDDARIERAMLQRALSLAETLKHQEPSYVQAEHGSISAPQYDYRAAFNQAAQFRVCASRQ